MTMIRANPLAAGLAPGPATTDRIEWIGLSLSFLPLASPISDAKVLTGRQKPLTEIAFLFAEIRTKDGHEGVGFSYSKRAGGPGQYAHAKEIAPALLGEDELAALKLAAQWPRLVEQAADAREPHRIAFYLNDLAAAFHSLWNAGNDDPARRFVLPDQLDLTAARAQC